VTSNYVRKSQEIFDNSEPKYDRTYFDEATGGFVLVHEGHNRGESFISELFIAQTLAKRGSRVFLLDESETIVGSRPDARVDREIWDFKRLTPDAVAFTNRIQAGIKAARKQSAVKVAYHIDREDFDLDEIERGIKRAFFLDVREQVQAVILVFKDEETITYTRDDL
jgi:Contact-dependent growth inhibition CdiA C-terminal domain